MSSSDDKFCRAVDRWCSSKPKPSIAVEFVPSGVSWPETFRATVKSFSHKESITFELESGEGVDLILRGFHVRAFNVRRPSDELSGWDIVGSFSLINEAEGVGLILTEFRAFGEA